MPSLINATLPVDGTTVRKSDLRTNFAAAKQEVEHGGFVRAPVVGAVERRVVDKLAEALSLKDFGAACDGATDDTPAWNLAVQWLAGNSGYGRVLKVLGPTRFNPASVAWKLYNPDGTSTGTHNVANSTIEVEGDLRVTSTLRLPCNVTLLGRSGSGGVQFANGRSCQVQPTGTFTGPVLQLSGGEGLYNRLENVTVAGHASGPNIRIGYSGNEPGFGTVGGQTYKVWLKNVGAHCQASGQSAVEIFNCFWVWVRDFAFLTNSDGYAAVRIGGDNAPAAGMNTSGLLHFENGVVAGHGFVFDRSYATGGGYESFYSFRNIHYESCYGPLLHMKSTGGGTVSQILLENVEAADSATANTALLYIENTCTAIIQSVFFRMCPAVYMRGIAGNIGQIRAVHWDGGGQTVYDMGAIPIIPLDDPDKYLRGSIISYNGATAGVQSFGPSALRPQFVPAGFIVATPNALSGLTVDQGTGSIAAGHAAPDGTTGAIQVTITSAGGRVSIAADSGVNLVNGDYLVFGAFVRYGTGDIPNITLYANTNGGTGGFEVAGAFTTNARVGAMMMGFSGWACLWEAVRYVASGATQQATLHAMTTATSTFKLWSPFLVRVPVSLGWKRQDVVAWASSLTGPPQAGGSGVLALASSQALKTGRGVTGSRPSAPNVGAGAQWFDTTLNKPIWSDGTRWRDATGVLV